LVLPSEFATANFELFGAKWRFNVDYVDFALFNDSAIGTYSLTKAVRVSIIDPFSRKNKELLFSPNVEFSAEFPNNFVAVKGYMNSCNVSRYIFGGSWCFEISFEEPEPIIQKRESQQVYTKNLCQKLLENSFVCGSVLIYCKDDEIVKADHFVLKYDPFFKSMFHFKASQSCGSDTEQTNLTVDLSQFSASVVKSLVEFIYTGTFAIPETINTRLELTQLGDYTTNDDLCNVMLQIMEKENVGVDDFAEIFKSDAFKTERVRKFVEKCLRKK
jgi:BTB/POZ domain